MPPKVNTQNSVKSRVKKKPRGKPEALKPYHFKPGHSGNPGGRPKRDMAAEIAVAVFEENATEIYAAMKDVLLAGDHKVFMALGDRAYGKPIQAVKLDGNLNITSEERRALVGNVISKLTRKGE